VSEDPAINIFPVHITEESVPDENKSEVLATGVHMNPFFETTIEFPVVAVPATHIRPLKQIPAFPGVPNV
jgi:hypothetical protein